MMWKTLIFVLILITGPRIYRMLYSLGYHNTVYKQHPGHCIQVKGTENGSEDVELVQDGLAIISSGLWYPTFPYPLEYYNRKKNLLLFDMNKPADGAVPLRIMGDFDPAKLNPHGISVYRNTQGKIFVYVVNHDAVESVVHKFAVDVDSSTATFMKTFGSGDPAFHLLNDLTVVGEDQFYYTNYLSDRGLNTAEEWLQLHWGSVGYFDGSKGRVIVTGLLKPNGITSTRDGRTIFVANPRYRNILMYKRSDNDDLGLEKAIDVGMTIDNINIAETAAGVKLFIGSLPVRHKSGAYFKDPDHSLLPAHVLQVNIANNGDTEVMQLFADDGKLVSGSSSALVHTNSQLLIGSILTNAAYCDMSQPPDY